MPLVIVATALCNICDIRGFERRKILDERIGAGIYCF